MNHENNEVKLLAQALYEIRILLSSHLGSTSSGDLCVREAAHLAYALHNEALAVIEGRNYDTVAAAAKIRAIKQILPTSDIAQRLLGAE